MATIAAIATPPGAGAISLIRLSGADSFLILAKALGHSKLCKKFTPRTAHLCQIKKADGSSLDQALVTTFVAPHSFTGEHTVEIAGHGGPLLTRRLLDRLIECGASPATPGEFSQRAFLNGKLDLTQAEAIMDLIGANSDLAIQAANEQLEGHLGQATETLRNQLLHLIAHLEAHIDFPEEDIDPQTGNAFLLSLDQITARCQELLSTADTGRILRDGLRTVIYGAPNVGKSSLLNLLLGHDRAIVSSTAGTTRDTIEEAINLNGIPLRLIDTAGIRETSDEIEAHGVERSQTQASRADLILEIIDGSQPASSRLSHPSHLQSKHHLLILNKTDLGLHPDWKNADQAPTIQLSCLENTGLQELTEAIKEKTQLSQLSLGQHSIAINARHQHCLKETLSCLDNARPLLTASEAQDINPEFAAIDLRDALDHLGQIAGRLDTEDILGEIFANFCIGK